MNNASQQKGRKSLRPLAILLSIGCATVYYSLDQKLEFNKRQERLATVFNKENNYGMCSPAASELERWCQENYFGAKGLALRTLDKFLSEGYPTIKSDCELARHNKVFYRQHIQKFLHQLDRDEALRQELEEKVYDLEREIKMEVRRDDSGYTVSFREDESDVLYVKNFGLLKNDELLQLLFREITTGNISAVEYYQQRVEEVMESAPPLSALEENVQEDILEGFRGGDTYELLVAMAENGLEGVKLKEVYLNRERQLSQVISGNQELKMKYGQIIALSEERQRLLTENGRVEEARAYQQQRKMQQRELENLYLFS